MEMLCLTLFQCWLLVQHIVAALGGQNNLYSRYKPWRHQAVGKRFVDDVRHTTQQDNWKVSRITMNGQYGVIVVDTDTAPCRQDIQERRLNKSDEYPFENSASVEGMTATDLIVTDATASAEVARTSRRRNGVVVGWMERLRQLHEFYETHGHTMVPKRYKENLALGNWVSKQRQQYHNYHSGTKPCSLTGERIDLLNQLSFCWNATSINCHRRGIVDSISSSTIENEWWSHYETLLSHCQHEDIHKIKRQSKLGIWLDRQRKVFDIQTKNVLNSSSTTVVDLDGKQVLTNEQLVALLQISDVWQLTRRQYQWEMRYRDLQTFVAQYGHSCVPISYSDKHLAHWVSNQRKLYNLRKAGKRSEMTTHRIQKLEAIGFVWNRWDYEFSKKVYSEYTLPSTFQIENMSWY